MTNRIVPWTEEEDRQLRALHGTMPRDEVAAAIGRSPGAVRARITSLGIAKKEAWTAEEETVLANAYRQAGADGVVDLTELARKLGRLKSNVCRKARVMGLPTNPKRKQVEERKNRPMFDNDEDRRAYKSKLQKKFLAENGHPRGMAGKKHSEKTKAVISVRSRDTWLFMPEDKRSAMILKGLKTKRANGTPIAPQNARGTWKAGWREIGGVRNYYRSRWEANYARYLEWLRQQGQIASWEHEPETFWFEHIKRGVRSYLPDFKVVENGGSHAYHEVKGWMDSRSKTTISRFRKYYPNETLIVVDKRAYAAIERNMSRMLGGWE